MAVPPDDYLLEFLRHRDGSTTWILDPTPPASPPMSPPWVPIPPSPPTPSEDES